MASAKGYVETLLATALLLFVFSFWADDGMGLLGNLWISLIGALFIGSVVYGVGWLYRKSGLRVGTRGVIVYFIFMAAVGLGYLVFHYLL